MGQELFYQNLPAVRHFHELTRFRSYQPVPDDWLIVDADIEHSTQEIEKGRYKEVNALGVCVITAVLNIFRDFQVPFVFGGDGASLCIPPVKRQEVESALLFCKHMGQELYNMGLRVGMIPVKEIRAQGHDVKILKFKVSDYCEQALFSGGGLSYADLCLKTDPSRYEISEKGEKFEADFTGFECRWKDIPSRYGETVSWLIKVLDENEKEFLYESILKKMFSLYGDATQSHPLAEEKMRLGLNPFVSTPEIQSRTYGKSPEEKEAYARQVWFANMLGRFLMRFRLKNSLADWGLYKKQLILNADYRKFDDMLRVVLAGSSKHREEMAAYLETLYMQKKIIYGLHVSGSATMTCLVRDYKGEHYHFVDGSSGGYALAAKMMKEKWSLSAGR